MESMSIRRMISPRPVCFEPLEPRLLLSAGNAAESPSGERTISANAYLDKLHGMWLGEVLGQRAGGPWEGCLLDGWPAPVDWSGILATNPFQADDDTCFEYMHMLLLSQNPTPTDQQISQEWIDHVPVPGFYIANRQARWLLSEGFSAPDTGSIHHNMEWYAIDSQITTESLGALEPGMRQRAADLARQFGSVTNDGFALDAATYYAAMYSDAAFESNPETLVQDGLAVVPSGSYTYGIIQDVRGWYQADKLAGTLGQSNTWLNTQKKIYDKYYVQASSQGRYRVWIESAINTALTTMAILYGQGDFVRTAEIAAGGGFDADCNAATACGLIGMVDGFSGLPSNITSVVSDSYVTNAGTAFYTLQNVPPSTTFSQMAQGSQSAAEQQILLAGGSITGNGSDRVYSIPGPDVVTPIVVQQPTGPAGLVGEIEKAGGQVTVSASVETHHPDDDRQNLDSIIDGITDLRETGTVPYTTDDGNNAQPAGGDFYQLNFDRKVVFNRVVYYEGDMIWPDIQINGNPAWFTPRGGYFTDLRVEVGNNGVFHTVSDLHQSEPLDPNTYYQRIEFTFDAMAGDSVRIIGTAGGTAQFTSCVELEAYGHPQVVPGDFNQDGEVNDADYTVWADYFNRPPPASYAPGSGTGGGYNDGDYTAWADNYGKSASASPVSPVVQRFVLQAASGQPASVDNAGQDDLECTRAEVTAVCPAGYVTGFKLSGSQYACNEAGEIALPEEPATALSELPLPSLDVLSEPLTPLS